MPIILVNENFAELANLEIKKENYEFKCAYLYNEESFLRGNKAKILIQPRLYVNGIVATLKLLKEPVITVTVFNELGIPNNFTFKECEFKHTHEIEIELPIQNLVSRVLIRVNGWVSKMSGDEKK